MSFFEELGESIIKFGNNASNRVKETTDAAFSGVEKKARKQELDKIFVKLGKAYFDREVYGAMSYDIDELMDQARELDGEIHDIEGRMGVVRGEKICVSCKSVIKSGSAFCPICGSKQIVPETAEIKQSVENKETAIVSPVVEKANPGDDDIFDD